MMNSELTARQIADSILELENFARELNRESSSNALKVLRAIDGLRELQESRKAAAEPVAWTDEQELRDVEKDGLGYIFTVNPIVPGADPRRVIRLYAEPPVPVVPVVPEEIPKGLAGQIVSLLAHNIGDKFLAQKIWNACRAAMLQGAEPVSNHDELAPYYLQGQKDGLEWAAQLAEANHPYTGDWLYDDPLELAKAIRKGPDMPEFAGSSPVIPDGWISCSERMPDREYVLAGDFSGTHYLASIPNVQVGIYADWFDDEKHCWDDGDGNDLHLKEVTHWMPLPDPPQEVK